MKLTARENGHVVAQQQVELKQDSEQSEAILFNAGDKGAHSFQIGVEPVADEQNAQNNFVARVVNVGEKKMHILYVDGEPRWEYKFIRRAILDYDDPAIDFSGMVRTTQNKTYYQRAFPNELENGFPLKAEELFKYDGIIIGSVEANYFSPEQQQMLRDFADKRGGGVLFLAGRFALSDGGYANTPMSEMMPVHLPAEKTFSRDFADVELTQAGRESEVTRLDDTREANEARWKKMPEVANYAVVGTPKPGAAVLMTVGETGHHQTPLLVVQNYGRGRVGVFATGGSWRWKMLQDHTDRTHAMFWQQLMRWMVTGNARYRWFRRRRIRFCRMKRACRCV